VTWGNGTAGSVGTVAKANSLVGSTMDDAVGSNGVTALSNGSYVVASPAWNDVAVTTAGAVTWLKGDASFSGTVSTFNSLVGSKVDDHVGNARVTALNNDYAFVSSVWDRGGTQDAGAVTLASGTFRLVGTIQGYNSVRGAAASGGSRLVYSYDATRSVLAVGRPADNIVSLFTIDQIFFDNLE
jgi:hypothetical protein